MTKPFADFLRLLRGFLNTDKMEISDFVHHKICAALDENKRTNKYDKKGFIPKCQLHTIITPDVVKNLSLELDEPPDQFVKVIATLLYATSPTIKKTFSAVYASGLRDGLLPVTEDEDVKQFACGEGENRKLLNTTPQTWLWDHFVEDQWRFHLPEFGESDNSGNRKQRVLSSHCILPVVYCAPHESSDSGAYGEVHQIKLHHECLKISPSPTEEQNPMLALKKITAMDARTAYQQEEAALLRINRLDHKHLVKSIDSFKRGRDYFFLFPWADGGDLDGLWKKYDVGDDPKHPLNRSPEMKRWLLTQVGGIVSAINAMHNLPDIPDDSEENGRHGDIRSKNVLLFYDAEWGSPETETRHPWSVGAGGRLCLADVGLARFHDKITDNRGDPTKTKGIYLEYSPPEMRRVNPDGRRPPRSRKYDIWALGCLFHDLIIWVLFGVAGVERYRNLRNTDNSESPYSQFYAWQRSNDRCKVNPQVKKSLCDIRKQLEGREKWLLELTNIVEHDLLQVKEDRRKDAKYLNDKLNDMMKKEGCYVDAGPQPDLGGSTGGERSDTVVSNNTASSSKTGKKESKKKKRTSQLGGFFKRFQQSKDGS